MVLLKPHTRFFIFLILIVLFLCLGLFIGWDVEGFQEALGGFPLWASGSLFVALYVILTFFIWLGPKDILRVAAAYIYGAMISTVLVFIAEMFSVFFLFHLSRCLGRDFIALRVKGRMRKIDEAIADTSFLGIFFIRLLPFVPLRFLDLGFGLTRIAFKKYFFICLLATPLRIYIVQLFLALGLEAVMDPQRMSVYLLEHPHVFWASFAYLFGSLLIVFFLRARTHRRKLLA